jgi:hypothetical protein
VDQGPCGCVSRKFVIYFVCSLCHVNTFGFFYTGWVFFPFVLNRQVGMLHVHFTDPKLYILLHVLSFSTVNCYLLHFFMLTLCYFSTSSHQPLPQVSPSFCCICLIEENGTSYKYCFINTTYKRVGGTNKCHYSLS